MTRDEIANFYSKYSEQYDHTIGTLTLYDDNYKSFIENAPRKNSLLDLACGPGNVSAFIQKILPEIKITCVDLSREMLDIVQSRLPEAEFFQSDIVNLSIPQKEYDLVVCAFGFPFITKEDIEIFAKQLGNFMHEKSQLYISSMKGDTSQFEKVSFGGDEKLLFHYHTKEHIVQAFNTNGYQLISYNEQDYPEQDGSVTTDMVFVFEGNNLVIN